MKVTVTKAQIDGHPGIIGRVIGENDVGAYAFRKSAEMRYPTPSRTRQRDPTAREDCEGAMTQLAFLALALLAPDLTVGEVVKRMEGR